VYIASLLAIKVDHVEEVSYLQNLSGCLNLDEETVKVLNQQFQTQ
jgi:uncharacterized membrane protein YebE (DUF533 family)